MSSSSTSAVNASMVDPKLRGESTLGMQIGLLSTIHITALTISILRMYSRTFLAKAFGWDDGFMVGATLSAFISYILYIYQIQHGLGTHKVFVSAEDYWKYGAASFTQTILNLLGLGLLKISLSLSLLRLFIGRVFNLVLWGAIAFVTIHTIFAFLTLFLYCKPLSGFWDLKSGAKCYNLKLFIHLGLANTGLGIFTDILLASLPIPVIWQLQLKTKIRVYLIIMLALGWGAVGIGVVKATKQIMFSPFGDLTYEISIATWGFIQLNVSIIAGCAPQLKKLLHPLLRFTGSYTSAPYGERSSTRSTATGHSIGRRYLRQSSQADKTDAFELDQRPIIISDGYRVQVRHSGELGTHAVSSQRGDNTNRSDSSDSISGLENTRGHQNQGIVRTTEVVISTE